MSDPGPAAVSDRPCPPAASRIRDLLADAAARFAAAGCETPRLDAEVLLADVLGVARARLVLDRDKVVADGVTDRYAAYVARRCAREPVAYIAGRRGFRHLELRCDRRALIPRPESELLVQVGLTLGDGLRVLDVGTGSGAVALALKHERPDLDVIGVDVSADALALASENAVLLGVDVEFVLGDLRAGLECDAILTNLPYVEDDAVLAPEIPQYEPSVAVFAGPDGLDVIRRFVASSLDGVAVVALEHGWEQGPAIQLMLRTAGYTDVRTLPDLAGHPRVTVGRA